MHSRTEVVKLKTALVVYDINRNIPPLLVQKLCYGEVAFHSFVHIMIIIECHDDRS